MNRKKTLLAVTAVILTLSAVSCGKDNDSESSVEFSLSEQATKEETTEEATDSEETTATKTTTTGTETTATTTETTTATADESTTTTTATDEEEDSDVIPEGYNGEEQYYGMEIPNETQQDNIQSDETQQGGGIANTPQEVQQPDNNGGNTDPEPVTEPPQQQPVSIKFSMGNLLTDASGIISQLGTPDYVGQSPACTSNGNDVKKYEFTGLKIECYVDGGKEYIYSIELTDSTHSTDKNITVGSTRAEVEAVYGTGTESGQYTIYKSGDSEMDIQYSGDSVISIVFYTPV